MIEIGRNEAIDAIRAAAWTGPDGDEVTCGHTGCHDHAVMRTRIHSVRSGLGADWDLDAAVRSVEDCQVVGWAWSLLGHDLAVQEADGGVVRFQVDAPALVRQAWRDEAQASRGGAA